MLTLTKLSKQVLAIASWIEPHTVILRSLPTHKQKGIMRTTTYNYQRFSRQGLLSTTLIVAALALTLSACDQSSKSGAEGGARGGISGGPGGAPGGGSGEARPTEVVAYTIERGQVPVSSELSGRVAAAVMAEIRPQTGGIVRKVLFVEGSEVKAGQALYEIDSTSAQTSVSSAKLRFQVQKWPKPVPKRKHNVIVNLSPLGPSVRKRRKKLKPPTNRRFQR